MSTATQTVLRLDHVSKTYGEGESSVEAVHDVSMDLEAGRFIFLMGPSGSGKTTLLSMISGILRPTSGHVTLEGQDIWAMTDDQLADFRLNKIGFVFQDYHLFPRLTTLENAAIPLVLKKTEWDRAMDEAIRYLDVVGLKDRAALPPVKLSGGEQQRVAIARAIASQPDVLVFDEPTASLDGDTGRKIVDFVKREILTDRRCIILVSHDARIFEFADRIMKMEDGRLRRIEDARPH